MNTTEIINAIKQDKIAKQTFCGVVAIDQLPLKTITRGCSFIVNTETSREYGEHWFAIFSPLNGPVEYFDSYGIKPTNIEIYQFIRKNGGKYIYNTKKIQGNNSISCGQFSILYIYFRSRGYTMSDYIKFYTSNKTYNDILIKKIYNKMIKM
jgi:hypothetical protein